MRKRRNQYPSPPVYNLEDEINTKNYQYYRTIPIKHISDKQHKMQEPPKNDQSYNVEYDNSITEYSGSIPEQHIPEQHIPEQHILEQKAVPLPVFNLIKNPGESFYRVNMPTQEQYQQQYDMNKTIKTQDETIETNNAAIVKQVEIIHTHNETIKNNNFHIQNQIYAYNNNFAIVQQQSYTYQTNASYIIEQEQTIESLKEQIQDYESQIEQQRQEIDANQQQMTYHGTMLSAFNTMLQNPAYFTQLVVMSMEGLMPPDN